MSCLRRCEALPTPTTAVHQLRPDTPPADEGGNPIKYLFPKDSGGKINVHPWMRDAVADPTTTLLIVEGTKQTLAAVSAAYPQGRYAVVGVGGCWGWSRSGAPTPELNHIPLAGRGVVVAFDADVATNFDVWQAAKRLTDWLYRLHGVARVRHLMIPNGETTGLDDALALVPDRSAALMRMVEASEEKLPPQPKIKKDFFNGAVLATKNLADAVERLTPCALDETGKLYTYEDGRFVSTSADQSMKAMVGELLGNDYKPMHRAAVTEFLTGRLFKDKKFVRFRYDRPLLNVRNGMLDLETLALLPHDPNYMSVIQLPVEWEPDATCPLYEWWINEVIPRQVDDLEECAGTMLDFQGAPTKAILMYGPTDSGKSLFSSLMTSLIGEENASSITMADLANDRFSVADLYGKKLNVGAEMNNEHIRDVSKFKALTGGDRVTANPKHKSHFMMRNEALLVFTANELPTVNENSRAYFHRMKPFHFATSYENRADRTLEARLRAELPGILVRWVHALRGLWARGDYAPSDPAVVAQFETGSDRVLLWLAEEMTIVRDLPGRALSGSERAVSPVIDHAELPAKYANTPTDLREMFSSWCKSNGFKDMGRNHLNARLTSVDGVHPVRIKGSRTRALNIVGRDTDDQRGQSGQFLRNTTPQGPAQDVEHDGGVRAPAGKSSPETARTARDVFPQVRPGVRSGQFPTTWKCPPWSPTSTR